MTGKVMSGEKFRVVLKFRPGIPDNIDEIFLVECAHFPAERFKIKAVGIYPGSLFTLPRNDETFEERFNKTKKLLEKNKVEYAAKFTSQEVKAIPTAKGKQEKLPTDFYQMDIEAETDRIYLCEKLLELEEISAARTAIKFNDTKLNATMVATKKGAKASPNKTQGFDVDQTNELAVEEDSKIIVTNYVCDFGNIVVGKSRTKIFRMTNCGRNNISFTFDTKLLQQIGLSIDPNHPPRLFPPNNSIQFSVTYTTRKNSRHGKVKHIVPVHLSYGPSYNIEFVANLTIPELSMSTDNIDFEKV
jgi:hydrocephalus-inducing protein